MGGRRGAYKVLVGRPEKRRSYGKPRHRGEDDIKLVLQEVEWEAYTRLLQLRTGTGTEHL
jgi:hypothetical protein